MTVLERPPVSKPKALDREELNRAIRRLKPYEPLHLDRLLTIEEFCELVDEKAPAELIDGVIHMSPPPTDAHEDEYGWLFRVVSLYVEVRKLGKTRGAHSGIRITNYSLREPDVCFWSNASLEQMQPSGIHGAADFVVEIADSPAARRHAERKLKHYEQIGVTEVWLVDLQRKALRHLLLDEGRYGELPVDPDGEVTARTIPGLHLRVEWLFQGPNFPISLEVVNALLKEHS